MKHTGVPPLFLIAGSLLAAAGLATLLGLDAAAEKRAGADRFAVLLGAGLATIALSLAALTFFLVEVQRRLAARRMRSLLMLHDVIAELAESVAAGSAERAPEPVPVQRAARPRPRSPKRVLDVEPATDPRSRPARQRTSSRKSG